MWPAQKSFKRRGVPGTSGRGIILGRDSSTLPVGFQKSQPQVYGLDYFGPNQGIREINPKPQNCEHSRGEAEAGPHRCVSGVKPKL